MSSGSNSRGGRHKRERDGFENCLLIGYTISKFNSNWIIHLNIKPKTQRLLEKNIENLGNLGVGKDFSTRTQKTQTILREKNSTSEF